MICENEIDIRLATMDDLQDILVILDNAAAWLYEIGNKRSMDTWRGF